MQTGTVTLKTQHTNLFLTHLEDVASADLFLITFCKKFEVLYGRDQFKFNMHLHMHLKQCLTDFGPSHSFWCFSFEQFNGLLGSYSTNKKSIEVQVMRKFCTAQDTYSLVPYIDSDLQNVLRVSKKCNKSISTVMSNDHATISLLNISHAPLSSRINFEISGIVNLLPPLKEEVLTFEECTQLKKIYTQIYPMASVSHISHFFIHCKQMELGGNILGSVKCGSASSVIMAYWSNRGDDLSNIDYASRMSVGVVEHYIKHKISMKFSNEAEPCTCYHVFARVSWKQRHPSQELYGTSATACLDSFEA